jgi:hypothetical protein
MNDRLLSAASAGSDDDWLDAVLRADGREHRATYLDDGGFTARLMFALPAPAALPAWRKPALTALWAAAGIGIAAALPSTVVDFAHAILRMIVGQQVSITGIAVGVAALGVATWTATAYVLRND